MNLLPKHVANPDFVEVVQASLDGHVYFWDLATGEPSRQASFWDKRSQAHDAQHIWIGHPKIASG